MQVLLDIKDSKASFFMEVLKSFSFVKTKELTPVNTLFLNELKEAVEEMTLVKAGRKKARNAEDFLNEL